jgi:hypothetical protein
MGPHRPAVTPRRASACRMAPLEGRSPETRTQPPTPLDKASPKSRAGKDGPRSLQPSPRVRLPGAPGSSVGSGLRIVAAKRRQKPNPTRPIRRVWPSDARTFRSVSLGLDAPLMATSPCSSHIGSPSRILTNVARIFATCYVPDCCVVHIRFPSSILAAAHSMNPRELQEPALPGAPNKCGDNRRK